MYSLGTLVYRIDVHARLLILRKKSTLHGLILVCTFIDFDKKIPPCTFIPSCTFIDFGIAMSNLEKKGGQWLSCHALVTLAISWTYSKFFPFKALFYTKTTFDHGCNCALVYRKNFPLHGLILVCTFIDFEKKIPLCTFIWIPLKYK